MPYSFSPLFQDLIDALRMLPGVGPKSAQRMALFLLQQDRERSKRLGQSVLAALDGIQNCENCRVYTEADICGICSDPRRDAGTLCIVESPTDLLAIEQSSSYRGMYFVLMGKLSPLDGIGPKEVGMDLLAERVESQSGILNEIILATSTTVEGEATAQYIANLLEPLGLKLSRLAHGVPIGGELEFVDSGTLAHAIAGRRSI